MENGKRIMFVLRIIRFPFSIIPIYLYNSEVCWTRLFARKGNQDQIRRIKVRVFIQREKAFFV